MLLAGVATRDALALRSLVDRHSRLVMRIALRILHDYDEAEEVTQEVFLYVHQKGARFDASKGGARGWIVQLAYHRAFDRRTYLARRGFYGGTDVASLADTVLGDTDLDRDVGSQLSRAQLEKAFEELPEQQGRTLEMFYFEGLELRETLEVRRSAATSVIVRTSEARLSDCAGSGGVGMSAWRTGPRMATSCIWPSLGYGVHGERLYKIEGWRTGL